MISAHAKCGRHCSGLRGKGCPAVRDLGPELQGYNVRELCTADPPDRGSEGWTV